MTAQIKRSMTIAGHRTSITLEQPFWTALEEIARTENASVTELVRRIDAERDEQGSLTSAVRVFILTRLTANTAPPA